jgi:hypothetical protein
MNSARRALDIAFILALPAGGVNASGTLAELGPRVYPPGMSRLLLLFLLAAPGRAQELKTVCATRPLETLPAGVVFAPTDAFVSKTRDLTSKKTSEMERSPYESQSFPVIWDQRVAWSDGSQVSVSCTLGATLHQVEGRRFAVQRVKAQTVRSPYPAPGQPPEWLKVVYDLDDGDIGFPASLTCELASARQDDRHPYAPAERQHLEIGALQDLLAESLRMQVRTETDPQRCAALP